MLSAFWAAFAIIFVAELPDKTAIASIVLATRLRMRDVVAGAWLAFLAHTALSTLAGSALHLLPARPIQIASGAGFLVFAALAWRRDEEAVEEEEEQEVSAGIGRGRVRFGRLRRLHPALVAFAVIFLAEWGDLTQLATAALVARSRLPLVTAAGALAALWVVALLAALTGRQSGRLLNPVLLNRVAAAAFAAVGVAILLTALLHR